MHAAPKTTNKALSYRFPVPSDCRLCQETKKNESNSLKHGGGRVRAGSRQRTFCWSSRACAWPIRCWISLDDQVWSCHGRSSLFDLRQFEKRVNWFRSAPLLAFLELFAFIRAYMVLRSVCIFITFNICEKPFFFGNGRQYHCLTCFCSEFLRRNKRRNEKKICCRYWNQFMPTCSIRMFSHSHLGRCLLFCASFDIPFARRAASLQWRTQWLNR